MQFKRDVRVPGTTVNNIDKLMENRFNAHRCLAMNAKTNISTKIRTNRYRIVGVQLPAPADALAP
jgi:hypothetical protein